MKIRAFVSEHSATINDLADRGEIQSVTFVTPDGVVHEANSVWAATDWLRVNGYYQQSAPIVWELEGHAAGPTSATSISEEKAK